MTLTSLVFFNTWIATQFANSGWGTVFSFVSCRAPLLAFVLYLIAVCMVCVAHSTSSSVLCTNCCRSGRTDEDSPLLRLRLRQQQYVQWHRGQDGEQAGLPQLQEHDQAKETKPVTEESLGVLSCGWGVRPSAACWGVVLPGPAYKHHSKHPLPPGKGKPVFIFICATFSLPPLIKNTVLTYYFFLKWFAHFLIICTANLRDQWCQEPGLFKRPPSWR